MTRYDPFAHGQVRLGSDNQGDEGPSNAEDMLFDPGEPTKQAPPPDPSWSMNVTQKVAEPTGGVDGSEAMAFGNDILGEQDADADPIYGQPMPSCAGNTSEDQTADGAAPLPGLMGHEATGDSSAFAMPQEELGGRELIDCEVPGEDGLPDASGLSQPTVAAVARVEGRLSRRRTTASSRASESVERVSLFAPRSRKRSLFAALLPLILCLSGGTAVSWFWVMQHNPVMAGILGAATAVSAMFSWILLRG